MNLKTSSDGAPNVIKESDSSDSTWNQVVAANASPNPSTPNAFSYGYSHSGLPSFSPLAITTPPLSTIMFDPATHSISAVSVTDLSNILISTTSHKASVPNQLCLLSLDSVLRASDVNTNQTPVATEIKHMFPTEVSEKHVWVMTSSLSNHSHSIPFPEWNHLRGRFSKFSLSLQRRQSPADEPRLVEQRRKHDVLLRRLQRLLTFCMGPEECVQYPESPRYNENQ